jgi:hypothetical protein
MESTTAVMGAMCAERNRTVRWKMIVIVSYWPAPNACMHQRVCACTVLQTLQVHAPIHRSVELLALPCNAYVSVVRVSCNSDMVLGRIIFSPQATSQHIPALLECLLRQSAP